MLEISFDHLHIKSGDTAASVRFYVDALGAREVSRMDVGGGQRIVLNLAGVSLFVQDQNPDSGAAPSVPFRGLEHFALRVTDLDAEAERIQSLGFEFTAEPRQITPGVKIAFLKGPDGELIELLERSDI